MNNIKDDKDSIKILLENIDIIISYTKGINYIDFKNNILLLDAIMYRLILIEEYIKTIYEKYKKFNYNINWVNIINLVKTIVNDYDIIDYSLVYEVISNDIYDLRDNLMSSVACSL